MVPTTDAGRTALNEPAERHLRNALNAAINASESDLKTLSALIKDAKLRQNALDYFIAQEAETIVAIAQLKIIRAEITAAKSGGAR